MGQRRPTPRLKAPDGFVVEHHAAASIGFLRAGKRDQQIVLASQVQRETNTTQQAIDFSICAKSVEINHRKRGGLRQQIFVAHDFPRVPPPAQRHSTPTLGCRPVKFRVNASIRLGSAIQTSRFPRKNTAINHSERFRNAARFLAERVA